MDQPHDEQLEEIAINLLLGKIAIDISQFDISQFDCNKNLSLFHSDMLWLEE